MVILTITACKKREIVSSATENTVDKEASLSYCLTLEGYYKSADIEEKAEWLRKHGDSVCECTLEEAVLQDHRAKGTVSNQKGKYVITWGNLKKIIKNHGYDAYLSVEHSEEKIDSLKMVYEYISEEGGLHYRFSTALIRSLAKKYAKDDNSEFQFSFATLEEKPKNVQSVVVIYVNGNPGEGNRINANPYYDYSTDPHGVPVPNIPL
jgi:hypothetical protein